MPSLGHTQILHERIGMGSAALAAAAALPRHNDLNIPQGIDEVNMNKSRSSSTAAVIIVSQTCWNQEKCYDRANSLKGKATTPTVACVS